MLGLVYNMEFHTTYPNLSLEIIIYVSYLIFCFDIEMKCS